MKRDVFTVGLVQTSPVADPEANIERAVELVGRAATDGARVVCLPELFRSQYFCQNEDACSFDLAEPIPGPSTNAMAAVARRRKIIVLVPVFERRAAGLYHNSVVLIGPEGNVAGLYRKMHIPDDPGYYEKFYFTPGDLGYQAFSTEVGRIGALICWDQWYPEAARLTSLRGAEVIFYPTAIGWHPREKAAAGSAQQEAWVTIQRGHAIANGVYVAAVNRAGLERPVGGDGIEFWGGTFLCDPFGVVIARARSVGEEVVFGDVDLSLVEEVRRHWPFLRDRRIDSYVGLDKRFIEESGA
jgi:N-carbamoylputrescine amidase